MDAAIAHLQMLTELRRLTLWDMMPPRALRELSNCPASGVETGGCEVCDEQSPHFMAIRGW